MKSFVRDKDEDTLDGSEKIRLAAIVGPSVIALAIGKQMYGEAAYVVFILVAAIALAVQILLKRREERAKARSGGARSTGSR